MATTEAEVRNPDVEVTPVGEDGNAFAILGRVSKALRRAGYGDEVPAFMAEATSDDYDSMSLSAVRASTDPSVDGKQLDVGCGVTHDAADDRLPPSADCGDELAPWRHRMVVQPPRQEDRPVGGGIGYLVGDFISGHERDGNRRSPERVGSLGSSIIEP